MGKNILLLKFHNKVECHINIKIFGESKMK